MSEPCPLAGGNAKPTRKTKMRVNRLAKAWAEILYPGRQNADIDLDANEAGVYRLTEEQAHKLASELWAVVGQPGAYDIVDFDEDDEDDEGGEA